MTIVFDHQGLAGVRQRWVLDEYTTLSVLDLIRENQDGRLDEREMAAVKKDSFGSLGGYDYFTAILNQGQPFPIKSATDFAVELAGDKLVYSFFVPCKVVAGVRDKVVKVAVFDPSFYTYVVYDFEGAPSVDPSADPLFTDQTAEYNPGDFERFSKSVGRVEYKGDVELEGSVEAFNIRAEVVEAPEMAYLDGQVVPEAFVIRFRRP